MATTAELVVGSVYSLGLYPGRLYGDELKNVTFQGRVSADIVKVYGIQPTEEHTKVYSQLPPGTPNDPYQYNWLIFKSMSGNIECVGEPWVRPESIETKGETIMWTYRIPGDKNIPLRVRHALTAIGIYDFTVEGNAIPNE